MGGTFSDPIPNYLDTEGYVCMVLRSYDKFRIIHAPKDVQEMVLRVIREVSQDKDLVGTDKFGAIQYRLPGTPFTLNTGRESATIGKVFAIRIFEEMNHLGYDLVCSSDLSRAYDQSSWFFKKVIPERSRQPVLCVAPGGTDKLVVVRGCDYVIAAIKKAIDKTWPPGIQSEKVEECCGEKYYEFKLRGNPWYGQGDESTACRQLLLTIVGSLGQVKWRMLGATNLKGGTDSLFFVYDDNHYLCPEELAMLSLNRNDRIRLINFNPELTNIARDVILRFYQTKEPEHRDYYGASELKLKGYPFASSGSDAILTRQLICRLLEAFRNQGWEVLSTIDISRKVTDKSVFLMRKCESAKVKIGCISLSDVDRIRLCNLPNQVAKAFRDAIAKSYLPGIGFEEARDGSCYEIDLQGMPWTQNSSYNIHARSMLTFLMREAYSYGWSLTCSADVSAKYVHTENGPDYPVDVHSWFLTFQGMPKGVSLPETSSAPISYAELRVSDLEIPPPPTYDEAKLNSL